MFLVLTILVQCFLLSQSNNEINCFFTVSYPNGSRSSCLDEECSYHLNIISIQAENCRTNYLSLKFSSYSNYLKFLQPNSLQTCLSSFFSTARPTLERLLQIEFDFPLPNDKPFHLDHLNFLSNGISNIDTYELIFNGNISYSNLTLFIDRDMFYSDQQQVIDTLRLIFNCTNNQRVEWELIKSIQSFPPSPCSKQIDYLRTSFIKDENCFQKTIRIHLIIFIAFLSILSFCLCIIYYFNENYQLKTHQQEFIANSRTELVSMVERF